MTYTLDAFNTQPADNTQAPAGLIRFAHELTLILGLAALLFWFLALSSFSAQDAAWSTTGSGDPAVVHNWAGRTGAWLADLSYFLLGYSVWWCWLAGSKVWLTAFAGWLRGQPKVVRKNSTCSASSFGASSHCS